MRRPMQGVSFTLSIQEIVEEKRPWTCIYISSLDKVSIPCGRGGIGGIVTAVNQVTTFSLVGLLKELVAKEVDWS